MESLEDRREYQCLQFAIKCTENPKLESMFPLNEVGNNEKNCRQTDGHYRQSKRESQREWSKYEKKTFNDFLLQVSITLYKKIHLLLWIGCIL